MPVCAETYQRVVLEDPDGQWELHHGWLERKSGMTVAHNRLARRLGVQLLHQLNPEQFDVLVNIGRVRVSDDQYYVPDVCVVPVELIRRFDDPNVVEIYHDPLPLVVEVWSRSTGRYDVDTKLPEYQRRGDTEIWRLHPLHRTLVAWRRQPDGGYIEQTHSSGQVRLMAIPHVAIDLDQLFAATAAP